MKFFKKYISIFVLLPSILFAQQESKITVGNGDKNTIEVIQKGKDTVQKSDIDVKTGGNKIKVNQEVPSQEEPKESNGIKSWTENINGIFLTLISIATFIGLAWKGIQYFKNKQNP
jgi:hypothetical protein